MKRFVLCSLLLSLPLSAQAQSVDELRQRVAALRSHRPATVPEGTLTSIEYLLDVSERIEPRFETQSVAWRERAARFLTSAESGRDPYPEARGQLLNRGYDATFSPSRQGYAVYIPPDYDPSRSYPLMIMLHGGSSNGNLFLGVVLGNNMDWLRYSRFLWDDFTARWSPDWIVVAPDGVGQLIWRWMGEQDVLEVIDDVQRHYNVDPNRVALGGLSNGGMGAYSIGMRHAWRFSVVQAMAGAPSWLMYAGGRPSDAERVAMERYSAMLLLPNANDTNFFYYHGTVDPGPMRPAFIRELDQRVEETGVHMTGRWYEHGHDLLYLVHRHGRVYPDLARFVRDRHPSTVDVVSGDYRAARQHWVTVTRFERYPELGRVHAAVADRQLTIETDNILELAIDMRDVPLADGDTRIEIDGTAVYSGPRANLGHEVHIAKNADGAWGLGFLPPAEGLEKIPRLSGPMSDAYHDRIIHVYGTQHDDNARALRRTAELGAQGWPVGVWSLRQTVVADTDVTPEMMRSAHLALYGSPGDNAVLERMMDRLPIRLEDGALVMDNGRRFEGRDVGVRYIYPNPEAPGRYVLVHAGLSADAVSRTRNLPDFVPDYVVYDRRSSGSRPRLIMGRNSPLAAGYFDRFWQLPPYEAPTAQGPLPPGVTAEQMRQYARLVGAPDDFIIPLALFQQTPAPELPPGELPDAPATPRRFLADRDDPNGPIARLIARLVPTFYNYRAMIPGGVWTTHRNAAWKVRPEADCLAALDEDEVPYRRYTEETVDPIPTPVEITGRVGGVAFSMLREEPLVLSCEMATRLPVLARIARRQDVRAITILSAHRGHPRQSFHRMGMALDVYSFSTSRGQLIVNDHFVETPSTTTCDADEPSDWRAAALLRIACDLAATHRFNSVLTPNYNDGHRNHFHLDIRPDDNRIFIR
ncbi:MAG: extensin family protein [Sandaracinaceae bacterium]